MTTTATEWITPPADSSGRTGYPLAQRLAEPYNVVGFERRTPPPFN
jgi:hypothetical protein